METVREANGLAMSSRNGYLTAEEKERGAALYKALCNTRDAIKYGNHHFAELEASAKESLTKVGFEPEYFTVCRADNLEPAQKGDKNLVILAAARMGKARLIDNIDFVLE